MTQDKQKLNKKIARWCGEYSKFEDGGYELYFLSDGAIFEDCFPNFTDSMDACIRWIVPKLFKEKYWYSISQEYKLPIYVSILKFKDDCYFGQDLNSMPLAFCLAVEKLIDSEVKQQ